MPKVLVVDDEQDILDLVDELFSMAEFEVVTRTSASEALELIANEKFDAIVSDIVMPEISGLQFFETLKEKGQLVHPFVLITGYANENPEAEALVGNGVDKIFVKPLQFYEIAEYLKRNISS